MWLILGWYDEKCGPFLKYVVLIQNRGLHLQQVEVSHHTVLVDSKIANWF